MFESTGIIESPETSTEITEVFESTNLSPLLDETLKLREDISEVNMGIEESWTEANSSTSECAIPLPSDHLNELTHVGADPIGSDTGVEHGPSLPPNFNQNNHFDNDDVQLIVSETDPKIPGVCGLQNLGNTCFMAAGLQCLTATPPVVQHFFKIQQHKGEQSVRSASLMDHFSDLLGKMRSGEYKVVRPIEFKLTLGIYHTQFRDYRQHDCQEFLALLLDSLHEQMNTAKIIKNSNMSANTPMANMLNSLEFDCQIDSSSHDFTAMRTTSYTCSSSPECPNSPNLAIAGSPRDLTSSIGDLDSAANTPHGSPLNEPEDDDETLDSDETAEGRSNTFIHNRMIDEEQLLTGQETYDMVDINSARYRIYDMHKEAKISNTNFLITQAECNNKIHYDSRKFPKESIHRMPLDNSNLTKNQFDNESASIKRIKDINVVVHKVNYTSSVSLDTDYDTGLRKSNFKRIRLDDQDHPVECSRVSGNCAGDPLVDQDELEADKHWAKHLQSNHSIIVDTFQGQFKSTVVCAVCQHVSVTYEPFMYLSVPLPHAMERHFNVTYVPGLRQRSVECVVSVNKQLNISKFKQELLKVLGKENIPVMNIAVAEVFENHIARILEDNTPLRCVDNTNRSIYAFQLANLLIDEEDSIATSITEIPPNTNDDGFEKCGICLSDDFDLNKSTAHVCPFLICDECIQSYFAEEETIHDCAVCKISMTRSSWVKVNQSEDLKPIVRIINVPLVLRHDTINEIKNNQKSEQLYGHPLLLKLPSRCDAQDLYKIIAKYVPRGEDSYTVHFVDGQGKRCSRCMYNLHCTGCNVPETGEVILFRNDTLAVRYIGQVPTICEPFKHTSYNKERPPHPLSLHDCLQAFSQSETLDEHNPWFCPKCERHRCATKTLTVHRYPKFLIVYLKRFVFYECTSMKLDDKVVFPLVNLSVGEHLYDLYACVCHFGGISAGHYTAYAKNPTTEEWFYYNDHITCKQTPQDDDFSNAYILFYGRQGNTSKSSNT